MPLVTLCCPRPRLGSALVAASVFIMPSVLTGCFDLGPVGCEDLATPADYPPLSSSICAHAQLQVDGKEVSEQGYSGAWYDDSGVDEQRLRVSIDFDHLDVQVREIEPGTYPSDRSESALSWWESGSFDTDPDCGGQAVVTIAGSDAELMWGDVEAVLCDRFGDGGDTMQLNGRFTASVE
jgi:hypothetical protein